MDTNKIKSFAKQARLMLLEGVLQRLKYWGYSQEGACTESLQITQGGYIFRGQVFTDTTVPKKWEKLKKRLNTEQDVKDVIEEAAYTWFNRLMAVKILEVNGYLPPTLDFAQDIQVPVLVQNAKRGQHNLVKQADIDLLIEYLQEDKEEQAFGLLVTDLCNTNNLLHDVFGKIDDYTELLLPQNLMQAGGLLELINSEAISVEDYKEVELIGWLYQFYISDKKDEVFAGFKKNKKARAEDIPAATQIFTPKWIVKYMVENTVGKIYLDYEPDSPLKSELKYLVENEGDKSSEAIISDITELTLIDPACGSGHILVTGFELLFKMYREGGYTARQAVDSILKNNIYGLDIDDRAMQLARFAVLLKAAQFDADVLNRKIIPNIYSFPENTIDDFFKPKNISFSNLEDWINYYTAKDVSIEWKEDFIDDDSGKKITIDRNEVVVEKYTAINEEVIAKLLANNVSSIWVNTYDEIINFLGSKDSKLVHETASNLSILRQGKNFGSTIKLKFSNEILGHIKQQYNLWLERETKLELNVFDKLVWDNLKMHLEVLFVLARKYSLVVANPPYLGSGAMNVDLANYLKTNYPDTKYDLYSVFMDVCSFLAISSGYFSMINQHSWMFLSSYKKFRNKLLSNHHICSLLHLGINVFKELNSKVVQSVAFAMKKNTINTIGNYYQLLNYSSGFSKELSFLNKQTEFVVDQSNFKKLQDQPIAYWGSEQLFKLFSQNKPIKDYFPVKNGMSTTNNVRFTRFWYEVNSSRIAFLCPNADIAQSSKCRWFPYNKGGDYRKWYGNFELIVNWEDNGKEIKDAAKGASGGRIVSEDYYFKNSISWSKVTSSGFSVRRYSDGFLFDVAGPSIFGTPNDLSYLLGLLNSRIIYQLLEKLSPTINYEVGQVGTIPFIEKSDKKEEINTLVDEIVDISKFNWNSFETSWDFEKSPLLNNQKSLLSSYQYWSEQVNDDFFQLHTNEEEINRIFIDIYGLNEELTPEVALKDITILQNELDRNALEAIESKYRENGKEAIELPIKKQEILCQFISYAIGVFLGRYRLDKPSLNIAHPNPSDEETASYNYNGYTIEIDEDGILPLMGEDCAFPDDALVCTKDLIHAIWGEDTLTDNINFLHECLGMDLHKWLTEKFWGYHTSMYKKKPIYWLFSSDAKKPQNAAFKVLVYMHRLDKYTVQKIQRNYLHPHQEYIKREIEKLEENELILSRDELKKLEKLRNWKIECRDYNEVLKELANQQIEFDLDDGVSANYAKFERAVAKI